MYWNCAKFLLVTPAEWSAGVLYGYMQITSGSYFGIFVQVQLSLTCQWFPGYGTLVQVVTISEFLGSKLVLDQLTCDGVSSWFPLAPPRSWGIGPQVGNEHFLLMSLPIVSHPNLRRSAVCELLTASSDKANE
jgi:hypothetical protein